eukprot:TRINITY_DN25881_c0_g2_i2.p2 TRINITY_DN25881_c0_g2~~TRINITY_DN25881_c0_g2_i2.p2  ORF type:complete len:133 (-),score=49.16 TRINITY_DN25881_c0_g2_i2:143-541(-)
MCIRDRYMGVQNNLKQIVQSPLSESDSADNKYSEEEKSESAVSALRLAHYEVAGQFDLTMGKANDGMVNLFCQERLQLVQLPMCFIPKGVSAGGIISISIARKKTDEEHRDKAILEIQKSLMEWVNKKEELG